MPSGYYPTSTRVSALIIECFFNKCQHQSHLSGAAKRMKIGQRPVTFGKVHYVFGNHPCLVASPFKLLELVQSQTDVHVASPV